MQLLSILTIFTIQKLSIANVIPIRHETERLVMTEDDRSLIMDSNTVKIEQTPRNKPIGRIEIRLNTTKSMVIIEENSAPSEPLLNTDEKLKLASDAEAVSPQDAKTKIDDGDKATLAITLKENDNNDKSNKTDFDSTKSASITANHLAKVENYAELPIDDDEEDEEVLVEEVPVEKCFRNKNKLSIDVLAEMKRERRKLKRTLKRLRAQLNHFCTLKSVAENREYRQASN
uniref:BZIP domain-containing protein n=1 Tax=Syphacia muris TaxID=451379 RepID=A0A0N5AYD0_9BILA